MKPIPLCSNPPGVVLRRFARLGCSAVVLGAVLFLPAGLARAQNAAANTSPAAEAELYQLPEDPAELLRLDDEMRAFFAARVRRNDSREERIDAIVAAILGEQGLHFRYESDGLYDVREAFHRRRGNCVTFALLVAAVAREFRIPARFNEVDIQPRWSRIGGLVLESRHINVQVEAGGVSYEVDLKMFADLRSVRRSASLVSDERAFAGLYSNAGVYRLAAGDRVGAQCLLERATTIDPTFASGWSNLGTAYLLAGETERARLCFERVLADRSASMAAVSGLAWVYRTTGRQAEAERLERTAVRYRERNPYYLLALARDEVADGRPDSARRYLVRAMRIKGDEPEFYELMVQVSRALGRDRDAERWAERLDRIRHEVVAQNHRQVEPSDGPISPRW